MKPASLFVSLLSVFCLFIFSSCEKEEPEPVTYTPDFSIAYERAGNNLNFLISCTTDDVEINSILVSPPALQAAKEFEGPLMLSRNVLFTFNDQFNFSAGAWSFTIAGKVRSGEYLGALFNAEHTINISSK